MQAITRWSAGLVAGVIAAVIALVAYVDASRPATSSADYVAESGLLVDGPEAVYVWHQIISSP